MKSNFVRCVRCAKVLIMEEFENHECVPSHKGDKRLEISQRWESQTERGEHLIMAFGLDGYIYRLVEVEKSGFEVIATDESYHPEKAEGDDDNRRTAPE